MKFLSFLLFSLCGCRQLRKISTEADCTTAARAFSECSAISPNIDAPYTYNEITAAATCQVQPDCLDDYFACVTQAFSQGDCSTEEGSDATLTQVRLCPLPEHHPEDCPIEQYLPDDDCGGTTPTILSVTCSYPGIQYSINDDADLPSMNITVHTSDPDGDLTQYNLSLWVDTEIDGTASEEARFFSFDGETSIGVCDTDASYLGIDIYLKGGFPEFDTSYEWTFIVEDAAGLTSAPYTAMCTTPNENGDSPPQ